MKRILTLLLLSLITVTTLLASGSKETEEEIILWHSNSGLLGEAFESLVEKYNQDHEVKIKAVYQGKANDVLVKIKAAEAAGEKLPDIAQLDATAGLDMMYSKSVVTPEQLGLDTSDIVPVAYAAYEGIDGHIGVPFNSSILLYYYNKSAFDKAGVKVPGTLDEMKEILPQVKEANGGRPAFSGVPTTYELCSFLGAYQGGSYITDRKNGHEGTSTEVLFDDNGSFRLFLEKWKAIYDTGAIENLTSGVSDAFSSGLTYSMLASSSNLKTIEENIAGRFELAVAPCPRLDQEATGGSNVGGGCLVAFNDSTEVKEVLSFLISAESQLFWAENTGYFPISRSALESNQWSDFIQENPLYGIAGEVALSSDEKLIGLWIPSAYQVYYSFQSTIKETLENGLGIEEAEKRMADMIEESLEGYEN